MVLYTLVNRYHFSCFCFMGSVVCAPWWGRTRREAGTVERRGVSIVQGTYQTRPCQICELHTEDHAQERKEEVERKPERTTQSLGLLAPSAYMPEGHGQRAPRTNAEACRLYRERIKHDPLRYANYKRKMSMRKKRQKLERT
ncbi:hypothetical protein BaRGS_00027529 [Batillaria attramentaria]|uniref:Secreted protein n=1 Tax=Batillaria attramentaria TaxID=370345 RepID=A0ABD0K250_9CAEN